jgi:hypothetical protein
MSVFEGSEELSAKHNVWTEMEKVTGLWRKLCCEERIFSLHQRTVSINSA